MKKVINILFFVAIIMALSVNIFAADIDGDGIQDYPNKVVDLNNDGLDDAYRSVTIESSTAKDILIVHETKPLVYFGWYRTSQMTDPGWDLYQRAIDWADGGSAPANTDVILFTYNGTLDPATDSEDSLAVYNYLISAGYNVVEIHHQQDIENLPSSYYSSFDLAIYAHVYPRDATNIVNSGIPFISASVGETDEMEIGTGMSTMHEDRDEFYVVNNTHYITQPYPLGSLTFTDPMWTDASEAAGSGIALVVGDLPVWQTAYNTLLDSPSDLELLRQYRDEILSKTTKGKMYKNLLYMNSEEALEGIFDNPALMLKAKWLIEVNKDAVSEVLSGNKGVIYNTNEIISFLDAYAKESPPVLKTLANMVKREMLRKQRQGKLFLGFELK
jgi:hypothetical protein